LTEYLFNYNIVKAEFEHRFVVDVSEEIKQKCEHTWIEIEWKVNLATE
jgi:hypothetical protein